MILLVGLPLTGQREKGRQGWAGKTWGKKQFCKVQGELAIGTQSPRMWAFVLRTALAQADGVFQQNHFVGMFQSRPVAGFQLCRLPCWPP